MKHSIMEYRSLSLLNKAGRALWGITSALLFRPFATPLFSYWRILLLKIFGADIQWNSMVYASVRVWAPWNLKMGHKACLGPHVVCYNMDMIELEDEVTVSQWTHLCAASHDINEINNPITSLITAPIIIKSKVWIGSRAFIGMGVTVGEGAIVGATASVFRSVEPWTVVGGNPAKFLKKRIIKEC